MRVLLVPVALAVLAAGAVDARDGMVARAPAAPPAAKPRVAKPSAAKPAPASPATVAPEVTCPSVLGIGITSKQRFCDVIIGRNPPEGIVVKIPPHKGPAKLSFDLHNRQTYSEEQVKAGRAFAIPTATMGVLTMDGTLLTRGVVRSEFRAAADLVDRVGGGAGPGGVKAVAPTGTEPIVVEIPENVTEVSLLGEKLSVIRIDGTESFVTAGRPIALVSRLMVTYTPVPKPPARKPAPKKKLAG